MLYCCAARPEASPPLSNPDPIPDPNPNPNPTPTPTPDQVDGTTRIYAMPFTTSSTMWQLSFPREEEAACRLCKEPAALKDEILARCAGWHDPIPEMLRRTPLEGMSGYPVYDREVLQPEVL